MHSTHLEEVSLLRDVLQDPLSERRADHHGDAALARAHGRGGVGPADALGGHHGDGLREAHLVHEQGDGHALQAEVSAHAAGVHQGLQPDRRTHLLPVCTESTRQTGRSQHTESVRQTVIDMYSRGQKYWERHTFCVCKACWALK